MVTKKKQRDFLGVAEKGLRDFLGIKYETMSDPPPPPPSLRFVSGAPGLPSLV